MPGSSLALSQHFHVSPYPEGPDAWLRGGLTPKNPRGRPELGEPLQPSPGSGSNPRGCLAVGCGLGTSPEPSFVLPIVEHFARLCFSPCNHFAAF